ncbi:unnamed protein product [Prorocentrum cordatum]|uniref:Uncharacterized protein n=1 Tax=Prorocentrum cordatum TaxID=2364126 RepID=A0ABN9X443_9DINO|nr:unnamed protein product [Polarella glacialis]
MVQEDPAQRDGSAAVRARWHAWHSLPGDPADGGGRARSPRARGPPLARCPVATEAGTAAARSALHGAMSLQDCARLSARSENLAEPLQRTRRNKKRKIEEMP